VDGGSSLGGGARATCVWPRSAPRATELRKPRGGLEEKESRTPTHESLSECRVGQGSKKMAMSMSRQDFAVFLVANMIWSLLNK
jgi:hypothetical protein